MTAAPATPLHSPAKATRVWLIVLQVLAAPGVLIALFAALNSLAGILMAGFGLSMFPLSAEGLRSGLLAGLGYLIPPGLDLSAWLVFRKGRGGLAITLLVFCLLTTLCALASFGFELLKMFV